MSFGRVGKIGQLRDLDVPPIEEELDVGRARGGRIRDVTIFKEPPLRETQEDPLDRAASGAPEILSRPQAIWFMALVQAGFDPRIEVSWRGGDEVVGGARLDVVVFRWGRRFVFRVQSYWHDPNYFPERAVMDDIQRGRLEMDGWEVRDVWEWEIYLAVYQGTLDSLVWQVISGIRGA